MSEPLTADEVRTVVREELGEILLRLAGALGAAAQPQLPLPAMPADFDQALALVNGAGLEQLAELADAELAGLRREGIEEAIRFRRSELLQAAAGDHR